MGIYCTVGDLATVLPKSLRTLLDRRNVVGDPHKDFNACHDFLEAVIDGYIVAAICVHYNVSSPADSEQHLFPNGIPTTDVDIQKAINCISLQIELKYTKYSSSTICAPNDGMFNYSWQVLSMGLLARHFHGCMEGGRW